MRGRHQTGESASAITAFSTKSPTQRRQSRYSESDIDAKLTAEIGIAQYHKTCVSDLRSGELAMKFELEPYNRNVPDDALIGDVIEVATRLKRATLKEHRR